MRALERDGVMQPVVDRVEQALSGADHAVLAPLASIVRDYTKEAQDAVAYVAAAPKDVSRLHPRRITRYMSNLVSAALLIERAAEELREKNSARKAAVARLYCSVHLTGSHSLGGIGRDDRLILDGFEPITRYEELDPDRLLTLVA
jgi:acyl-CoA dehydrogenase